MPKVLQLGPYRFFFFSNEADEPPHVHVQRERRLAKFWLDPVSLERGGRFEPREIPRIGRLVDDHRDVLLEAWYEFFDE